MCNVTVVIPTRNEEENIALLIGQLKSFGYDNILIVDDSDDNTAQVALENDATVLVGSRKGLGQAIIDGIKACDTEICVVMDADLSHSPSAVKRLVNPIVNQGYDMTIGSRYVKGGATSGWSLKRRLISIAASIIAKPLSGINDNTSGFFAIRNDLIKNIELHADSWKIMLEILVRCKPIPVMEVPILFEDRTNGKSKFNRKQVIAYLKHLVKLYLFKYNKFIKFCIVGGSGAIITFSITWILTEWFNLWYMFSMVFAVAVATITNFNLNLLWTFKAESKPTNPDYEWEAYYNGNIIQKWWKRSISRTIREWMPPNEENTILEIGCGSSPTILNYGANATAIDVNSSKIKFMKGKNTQVQFLNKKIENVKDKYDRIICIEVLEHLEDAESAVKSISGRLNEGGKVILATPDYNRVLWRIAEAFTPYKEEHITQFSRKSLEILCAKYGLVPVKYKYIATCDLVEMFEYES